MDYFSSMKYLFTLVLIGFCTLTNAQRPERYGIDSKQGLPQGLTEGTLAPDFSGKDQDGNTISLSNMLKKGPVVLIFYRGYWCPVCNKHLDQFQQSLKAITNKGASVIAITPETNDGAGKTIEKNGLTFPVLSDKDYTIMDAYDVRFSVTKGYSNKIGTFLGTNIAQNNGDNQAYLPVPATYVIGTDRKIIKAYFDQNYKNRPTAEEIAENL